MATFSSLCSRRILLCRLWAYCRYWNENSVISSMGKRVCESAAFELPHPWREHCNSRQCWTDSIGFSSVADLSRCFRKPNGICLLQAFNTGATMVAGWDVFCFSSPQRAEISSSYRCSATLSCLTLCNPRTAARQAPLSSVISQSLLKFMPIELLVLPNHLILCHAILLSPSVFPSIRVFSSELAFCIRRFWYWSFRFSISPSSEYSGLVSFRMEKNS